MVEENQNTEVLEKEPTWSDLSEMSLAEFEKENTSPDKEITETEETTKKEDETVEGETTTETKETETTEQTELKEEKTENIETIQDNEELISLRKEVNKYKENIESLEKELDEKHESLNPEKIHGGKEGYINHLIREKGKQEGYNPTVVSRIINNDINKIDHLSLIMMDIENRAPELTGDIEVLKSMALKKVGINVNQLKKEHDAERSRMKEDEDTDIGEFDINKIRLMPDQKGELIEKASEIRKKFSDLKKVEPGEYKSRSQQNEEKLQQIETRKKELDEKWKDYINEVSDVDINYEYEDPNGEKVEFSFTDEDFKKQIKETILERIYKENIEPTKENIKNLKDKIIDDFWKTGKLRAKALKKMLEDARAKGIEETSKKYVNEGDLSRDKKTPKKEEMDLGFMKTQEKFDPLKWSKENLY